MSITPRLSAGRLLVWLVLAIWLQGAVGAAPETESVVSEFPAMWKLGAGETRSCSFEVVVLYRDPEWNALWVRRDSLIAYLSLDQWPAVLEPGQNVIINGRIAGGRNLVTGAQVTIRPPKQFPPAEDAGEWWRQPSGGNPRWVALSGRIRNWRRGDAAHASAELIAEKHAVKVRLYGEPDQALFKSLSPVNDGASAQVTGVLASHRGSDGDEWELWSPGRITLGAEVPFAPEELPTSEVRVVTSFSEFWQVPPQGPEQPMRFSMEMTVLYHDAEWKALWARNGSTNGYIGLGGVLEKRRLGEKVRLEGWLEPGKGRLLQKPQLTSLGAPEAIQPQPVSNFAVNPSAFADRFVEVVGYVNRQAQPDPGHLKLETIVDGLVVTIYALHEPDKPMPNLEGSWIHAQGVFCLSADLSGRPTKPEMVVDSSGALVVQHRLENDPRFLAPPVAFDELGRIPEGQLVHVTGTLWARQPGVSLTIGSGAEPIRLNTPQNLTLQVGAAIEAIGVPRRTADGWELDKALCRRVATEATVQLPRISLAEQLRRLTAEEARRGYAVRLSGIVTWADPSADFFFVVDATGGARVRREPGGPAPTLGDLVNIAGVSEAGGFAPVVAAATVQSLGARTLPEPRAVTLEQALIGIEEAQWVAMSGYVRAAKPEGNWLRLEMSSSAGDFSCFLPAGIDVGHLVGAVARVPGVCSAETNERRQLKGVRLWVPEIAAIAIEEARPENPFAVPARTIAELRQFGTWQTVNRRVRVQGVVVHQAPGRWLQLADGEESVRVLSRDRLPLVPGDRVEAVGFPAREEDRTVLRESVYRKIGVGDEPAPVAWEPRTPIDVDRDGRVVRFAGTLLDAGQQGSETSLLVQTQGRVYEAVLEQIVDAGAQRWRPGSQVEVTGLYTVKYDELKRPSSIQFLLRSPADVRVVQPAPWLTAGRAVGVTAALAATALVGWLWGLTMRRRVRRQTEQIRIQFDNEKAARLDAALARASKLESLGLLAGGIAHDFNNLLTVIMGNLSLARLEQPPKSAAEDFLRATEKATLRARDLTQQLLTFAKGGEPVREAAILPDIVRESASFVLHGSSVRAEFDIAADLWPANVDKGQIGQVVQNIVINARQAMPNGGVVKITLRNTEIAPGSSPELAAGRYLALEFSDNGKGIPQEVISRIFEPYFTTRRQGNGLGLATVFSIVKKHLGHITVASTVGGGTHFRIWLPAAATAPVAPPAVEAQVLQPLSGRVLFLDDEAPIREMAASLLTRMGLTVRAVADGQEVIDEYKRAARAGEPYHLVILDLTIPGGLGGAEAMAELRRADPNVLAIVSSGYSSNSVLANYRDYGFCAMVAKPYDFAELAQAAQRVLSTRRPAAGS